MRSDLLDVYTDYLIVSSSQTTATGLSSLSDETISHDEVTRMLKGGSLNSKTLWKAVKPQLKQIASSEGVLIIDDTISQKPHTDENEIVCWHYDHAVNRTVKGINFVSLLYEHQGVRLPIDVEIVAKTEHYVDAKSGKLKRRSPRTKNAMFRQMTTRAKDLGVEFGYVLADSWYASAENMLWVRTHIACDFLFALKSNRLVATSAEEKANGLYQPVSDVAMDSGQCIDVYLKGIPFQMRLGCYDFKNGDGTTGVLYLLSSDMSIEAEGMLELYKRRWSIETYHRSLKQNTSLQKSPTRRPSTQRSHLFASILAFVKLESLKLSTRLNHYAIKQRIYLRALVKAMDELHQLKKIDANFPVFA